MAGIFKVCAGRLSIFYQRAAACCFGKGISTLSGEADCARHAGVRAAIHGGGCTTTTTGIGTNCCRRPEGGPSGHVIVFRNLNFGEVH